MSNYQITSISKEEEILIDEIFHTLSENFNMVYKNNYSFDFKKFELFNHYTSVKALLCFDLNFENQHFQIIIINIEFRFIGGRQGDSIINENQIWGYKKLNGIFGNVSIREENMMDKLLEVFNKTEIDFKEDSHFSNRFFVLSDNENQTKSAFNENIRNHFLSLPKKENYIIEILNNEMIIGNRKPINLLNANQIANFLKNNF